MIKRKIIFFALTFVFLLAFVAVSSAASLSSEDLLKISECKKNCGIFQEEERIICKQSYNSCTESCNEASSLCLEQQKGILNSCKNSCKDQKSCVYGCSKEFNNNKRILCRQIDCKATCSSEYSKCKIDVKEKYKECPKNCRYTALSINNTCEDGRYQGGDKFLRDCEVCTCEFDSKVNCKKSDFCNFQNLNVSKDTCVASGGFFQQLCKGPYFGIGCGREYYCQCGGNNGYTCPTNYTCIKEFKGPGIKQQSVSGWKTLLGKDLGNIGLCAKNPVLESCGDGICNNVLAPGSDVAETSFNCPRDCF
ncbi:MAG: hypothetical protein WC796_04985 [Candidatus Pacearchaeota archaeon]|jgi:hypothetical protein